jgi:ribosomal protein S8
MKKKDDEENFDEAVAQAYRAWTATKVKIHFMEILKKHAYIRSSRFLAKLRPYSKTHP